MKKGEKTNKREKINIGMTTSNRLKLIGRNHINITGTCSSNNTNKWAFH